MRHGKESSNPPYHGVMNMIQTTKLKKGDLISQLSRHSRFRQCEAARLLILRRFRSDEYHRHPDEKEEIWFKALLLKTVPFHIGTNYKPGEIWDISTRMLECTNPMQHSYILYVKPEQSAEDIKE